MEKKININELKLFALGGQSNIYSLSDDKIIRIPRNERDYSIIEYEYEIYKEINRMIPSPKVFELIYLDSVPAIVMEKINGISMLNELQQKPWRIKSISQKLAKLHINVFDTPVNNNLKNGKEVSKYCVSQSQILNEGEKKDINKIIDELPNNECLCHGDFHPGNIIKTSHQYYIIDWPGSTNNDYRFDIAHTYLLLWNTPKLDSITRFQFIIQSLFAKMIAKYYINTMNKYYNINISNLSKYILVKAAERTFYGMESEKAWLLSYIRKELKK